MHPTLLRLKLHDKIDVRGPDECWPWTGGTRRGYGLINVDGKSQSVARLILGFKLGRPVHPDCKACHTCDNPPCANPKHLFEGTHLENMADMRAKGRGVGKHPGEAHGRAKMTDEMVYQARAKWAAGGYTVKELARDNGVAVSVMHRCLKRETWTHLPP